MLKEAPLVDAGGALSRNLFVSFAEICFRDLPPGSIASLECSPIIAESIWRYCLRDMEQSLLLCDVPGPQGTFNVRTAFGYFKILPYAKKNAVAIHNGTEVGRLVNVWALPLTGV